MAGTIQKVIHAGIFASKILFFVNLSNGAEIRFCAYINLFFCVFFSATLSATLSTSISATKCTPMAATAMSSWRFVRSQRRWQNGSLKLWTTYGLTGVGARDTCVSKNSQIQTWVALPSHSTQSGPPESPWQASTPPMIPSILWEGKHYQKVNCTDFVPNLYEDGDKAFSYRVVFFTGPTQKSSKYGTDLPNRKKWPSTLVPPKTSWPRNVLSMELVLPNRKKWLSTLVPRGAHR